CSSAFVARRADVPAGDASHHFYQKRDAACALRDVDLGMEGAERGSPKSCPRLRLAARQAQHAQAHVGIDAEQRGDRAQIGVRERATRGSSEQENARRAIVDEAVALRLGAPLAHDVGALHNLSPPPRHRGEELHGPSLDERYGADLGEPGERSGSASRRFHRRADRTCARRRAPKRWRERARTWPLRGVFATVVAWPTRETIAAGTASTSRATPSTTSATASASPSATAGRVPSAPRTSPSTSAWRAACASTRTAP